MVVHPETDNPGRFARRSVVETTDGHQLTVLTSGEPSPGILVRFAEVADRTAAEELVGTELWIGEGDRRLLEPDEYWPDEVIGCAVATASGEAVGEVVDVIEGAAQYRLVVAFDGATWEVPFVADLVPEVDVTARRVVVADIGGLLPER